MEKKAFIAFLVLILATFVAIQFVAHYRAPVGLKADFQKLPLTKDQWVGRPEELPQPIVEMLSPDEIFAGSFSNPEGIRVQLFVDYYSPENTVGAIHSPRNCLPGSGWAISGMTSKPIDYGGRKISAVRFYLKREQSHQVMDFWYVTRLGETASDYRLKFDTMISSLILRPTDKAFVRFVTNDEARSIAAMEDFEKIYIGEIYGSLPF
jgi:EpsI family protein